METYSAVLNKIGTAANILSEQTGARYITHVERSEDESHPPVFTIRPATESEIAALDDSDPTPVGGSDLLN